MKINLGKTHCDRMTEGNVKKEAYLHIWLSSKGYE